MITMELSSVKSAIGRFNISRTVHHLMICAGPEEIVHMIM